MNRAIYMTTGFFLGIIVLHPLSMAFQGLVHPGQGVIIEKLGHAYDPHHLPMAIYFGIIGLIFGVLNHFQASRLANRDRRVRVLEGLLPICAYCRRIRDEDRPAVDREAWHDIEDYLAQRTDATFTHGMCPDCYEKVMDRLDEEEKDEAAAYALSSEGAEK